VSLLSCPCALPASAVTAVVLRRYPVATMRTKCGKKVLLREITSDSVKAHIPLLEDPF